MGHNSPAQVAGPGANVDEMIAGSHERFVVLDDDDRVALLLQIAQGGDEPIVVARMEADRRLIEQIEHAHKSGADSRGQPHALPLAAAERVGGPVERQVIGADAIEKGEPALNLGHDRFGDRPLVVGKRQLAKELDRRRNRERRDFVNREAAQPAGARFGAQARAMAIGAHVAVSSGGWGRGSAEAPDRCRWGLASLDPSYLVDNRTPSPWHVGHAPYGLLKLNVRGSISPMLVPQRGHA